MEPENTWTLLAGPGLFGLQCLCFIFLFVGIIGGAYLTRRARDRAWGEIAQRFGLVFERANFFSHPHVSGTYRGHQLTLDSFTRGAGKSRTTIYRIVIFVDNRAGIYLALYEEGLFSKIGKFFGSEDVQIGDIDIDQRFIIKCRPENFASRLATSISLRSKLLEAKSLNIEVDGNELYFEQPLPLTDPDYVQFLFDLLSDLAAFIERG